MLYENLANFLAILYKSSGKEEVFLALNVSSQEEASETLRMAAAVKLYELGRLSSGAAARLAGVPRTVFLSRLADYGVDTFWLTEDQLQQETRLVHPRL